MHRSASRIEAAAPRARARPVGRRSVHGPRTSTPRDNETETLQGADDKPRLMVFPLDMAAHYLRCLELCKKLRSQFEIVVASSPTYNKFIQKWGFPTFEVANFDAEEITAAAARFDFAWLNAPTIERVLASQVQAIEEHRPAVVLGDAAFTLKMAAEITAVPFVALLNGYMSKYCRVTRKVAPSHPAYPYAKTLPSRVFDRLTRTIEHAMFEKIHAPFRQVRRRHRLAKRRYFLEELEGDLTWICDLPSFFPQKKLPATYEFIGPLVYDDNNDEPDIRAFLGQHHPNILVTMGSTGHWKQLRRLRDPLFQDHRIIVSGNGCHTLAGDHIFTQPFVNHVSILPHIDLVVCHGGNGTIYQALAHGVPLLCYPSHFEQEWNIQRLTDLGLGARLSDTVDAAQLRDEIETWIQRRGERQFADVQDSIKAFADKPAFLNVDRIKTHDS